MKDEKRIVSCNLPGSVHGNQRNGLSRTYTIIDETGDSMHKPGADSPILLAKELGKCLLKVPIMKLWSAGQPMIDGTQRAGDIQVSSGF